MIPRETLTAGKNSSNEFPVKEVGTSLEHGVAELVGKWKEWAVSKGFRDD